MMHQTKPRIIRIVAVFWIKHSSANHRRRIWEELIGYEMINVWNYDVACLYCGFWEIPRIQKLSAWWEASYTPRLESYS